MNVMLAPAGFAPAAEVVQREPRSKVKSRTAVIALLVAAMFAQFVPASAVEKSPLGVLLPDVVTETVFAGEADACGFWDRCYWTPGETWSRGTSNAQAVGSYLWGGTKATVGGAVVGGLTGGILGWGAGTAVGQRFGPVASGASGGFGAGTGAAVGAVVGGVGGGVSYVFNSIFG